MKVGIIYSTGTGSVAPLRSRWNVHGIMFNKCSDRHGFALLCTTSERCVSMIFNCVVCLGSK